MQFPRLILSLLEMRAHVPNQPGFGPGHKGTSYRTPEDNDGSMRLFFTASVVLFVVILFVSFFLISPIFAQQVTSANVVVTQAWSRATPSGSKVAGGYLTIENKGPVGDKLLSASTDAAKKIEIHEMAVNNGVMTMRPAEGLPIESGGVVKFVPGGVHLMIIGLTAPLVQGDKVPVVLKFEKAGEIAISFDVRAMGAPAPGPLTNVGDPAAYAAAGM
jgi:periplasmic copper chaperone A